MFSRFRILTQVSFSLISIAPGVALADGGISHGGGKGILCQEEKGPRVYLADTFELVRSGALDHLKPVDPQVVVPAAVSVIDKVFPAKRFSHPLNPEVRVTIGWLIQYNSDGLFFKIHPKGRLKNLADDHIRLEDLPKNCRTKVQLAVQDVPARTVTTDYKMTNALTWLEYGFLQLHEAMISTRDMPGADTTPIRQAVAAVATHFLDRDSKEFHQKILDILNPKNGPGRSYALQNLNLKTLYRVPERLSCYTAKMHFELIRVQGDGRPDSFASTVLEWIPLSSHGKGPDQVKIDLLTHRQSRAESYRAFGLTHLSMTFKTKSGSEIYLKLDRYRPETKELAGTLTTGKVHLFGHAIGQSSTPLSCFSDTIEFAVDPQSNN